MSADLPKPAEWLDKILTVRSKADRDQLMLEAYRIQYDHNEFYRQFCQLTKRTPFAVAASQDIPYLPVSFFKSAKIVTGKAETPSYFKSSGTSGTTTSRHYFNNLFLYNHFCIKGFEQAYGSLEDYCVLALLPSYLEQGNSSLVYMATKWMEKSGHPLNGFFLNDLKELHERLVVLEKQGQPAILIGVTYALLDFAASCPLRLRSTIVMETGGMKGRRKEILREEVHRELKQAFHLSAVHSEYGMTELFSQAYSQADGVFYTPPWMQVSTREVDDPFGGDRSSGVICVADLLNIQSCCFVATEDRGRMRDDGGFEVLGRLDNSDIRGCSLMYDAS